jgi:hypothetical protein
MKTTSIHIDDLPVDERTREVLATSMMKYRRFARLALSVDTIADGVVWCTAHQYEPAVNGRVLTAEEIDERARAAFAPLAEHGLTPVVCVYTLDDAPPERPKVKHRSASTYNIGGTRCTVLRIAHPRAIFTNDGAYQRVLRSEGPLTDQKARTLAMMAQAWAKRAHYRRPPRQLHG